MLSLLHCSVRADLRLSASGLVLPSRHGLEETMVPGPEDSGFSFVTLGKDKWVRTMLIAWWGDAPGLSRWRLSLGFDPRNRRPGCSQFSARI